MVRSLGSLFFSMEGLNCKPVLVYSQILLILSILLIEQETNMHILFNLMFNCRILKKKKLTKPWNPAS